jgi:hypothetical protein
MGCRAGAGMKFEDNRKASSLQGNARETKEKRLDFLAAPWPNRDFSKGCEGKNEKIALALNSRLRLRHGGPKRFPSIFFPNS